MGTDVDQNHSPQPKLHFTIQATSIRSTSTTSQSVQPPNSSGDHGFRSSTHTNSSNSLGESTDLFLQLRERSKISGCQSTENHLTTPTVDRSAATKPANVKPRADKNRRDAPNFASSLAAEHGRHSQPLSRGSGLPQMVDSTAKTRVTIGGPQELQFMLEPFPILPQRRVAKSFLLRDISIHITSFATCYVELRALRPFFQVEINGRWTYGEEDVLGDIERATNLLLSLKENQWFDPQLRKLVPSTAETSYSPYPHMIVHLDFHTPFTILAWNVRGISRPGFKTNIQHIAREHYPDLLILTEMRTSRENTMRIVA